MDSTKQEVSTGKNTSPKEAAPKKFLLTLKADGSWKKRIYVHCTEPELQAEKERWAMLLEEQTGKGPWVCIDIREADKTTSTKGREADGG